MSNFLFQDIQKYVVFKATLRQAQSSSSATRIFNRQAAIVRASFKTNTAASIEAVDQAVTAATATWDSSKSLYTFTDYILGTSPASRRMTPAACYSTKNNKSDQLVSLPKVSPSPYPTQGCSSLCDVVYDSSPNPRLFIVNQTPAMRAMTSQNKHN